MRLRCGYAAANVFYANAAAANVFYANAYAVQKLNSLAVAAFFWRWRDGDGEGDDRVSGTHADRYDDISHHGIGGNADRDTADLSRVLINAQIA
jgi:hypothetical protein